MEDKMINKIQIVPTLSVKDANAAIEYYKQAFNAKELMYNTSADGKAVAELAIGDARFVVADESTEHKNFSPETLGGTPVRIGSQVENPDAVAKQAVLAGAKEIYPVANQDYGY